MTEKKTKEKRCWNCKQPVDVPHTVAGMDGKKKTMLLCKNNCGPKVLADMFRIGGGR